MCHIIIDGAFNRPHKHGHSVLLKMPLDIPPHLPPTGLLSQLTMPYSNPKGARWWCNWAGIWKSILYKQQCLESFSAHCKIAISVWVAEIILDSVLDCSTSAAWFTTSNVLFSVSHQSEALHCKVSHSEIVVDTKGISLHLSIFILLLGIFLITLSGIGLAGFQIGIRTQRGKSWEQGG